MSLDNIDLRFHQAYRIVLNQQVREGLQSQSDHIFCHFPSFDAGLLKIRPPATLLTNDRRDWWIWFTLLVVPRFIIDRI